MQLHIPEADSRNQREEGRHSTGMLVIFGRVHCHVWANLFVLWNTASARLSGSPTFMDQSVSCQIFHCTSN